MSWLSSATGIHISPKGVKIEPLKALGTVATLGTLGAAGPLAGAVGKLGSVAAGAVSHIPGGTAVLNAAKSIGKIKGVSQLGSALKGAAGNAIDYATQHPLDVAQGVNSAFDAAHARDLEGRALGAAQGAYDSRAGLRTAGVQGLLSPSVPDMGGLYDMPGNVYAKPKSALRRIAAVSSAGAP